MSTISLWPAIGQSVPFPEADDVELPASGGSLDVEDYEASTYLQGLVRSGKLLTYDPLGAAETASVVYGSRILRPEWFGARGDGETDDTEALRDCIEALATYDGIDFGARTYYLGTRSSPSNNDSLTQLRIDGFENKTLIGSGCTFVFETTSQTYGYTPKCFIIKDSSKIRFLGSFTFVDSKSWSLYDSYGATGNTVSTSWNGLSGMYAIAIYERCEDLSFGELRFEKCRFGIGGTYEDGAIPTGDNRARRIKIDSISAFDCEYPLGGYNNGDQLTCASLISDYCLRPYFGYGITSHKADLTVYNSFPGYKSSVARKHRDTADVDLNIHYHSDDGYPYPAVQVSSEPVAGTGDPWIKNVSIKLSCKIESATGTTERTYAALVRAFDTSNNETTFSAMSGGFAGIYLDIDKGEFEHYLGGSGDTSTAYEKVSVTMFARKRTGGTYDVSWHTPSSTLYANAKKFDFVNPQVYEYVSSDTVHDASYSYPISGWKPWKDATQTNVNAGSTVATINWAWVREGARVHYELYATVTDGAGLTALSGNNYYFQMPYVPKQWGGGNAPAQELGHVEVRDASTGDVYFGRVVYDGSSSMSKLRLRTKVDSGGTYTDLDTNFSEAGPFTPATGDTVLIRADYLINNAF